MKKKIIIAFALIFLLILIPLQRQFTKQTETKKVLKTVGITEVFDVYHQVSAIVLDYGENVNAPNIDAYTVEDFDTADLKESYDRRESSKGIIKAVYVNDSAAKLDDPKKAPKSGRYVVVELEPTNKVEFVAQDAYGKNQSYRPTTATGIITWRKKDDKGDWRRTDFSKFIVKQVSEVKSANGKVVFPPDQMPTIKSDELINIGLDKFVTTTIESKRGTPINFSYYHPDKNNKSKKYPMMVLVTGGGGQLDYAKDGTPKNIGGNISRENVPIKWANQGEDMIVVSIQIPRNSAPYFDKYDENEDSAELIKYFIDNMSADPDRVYGMGSSFGTLHWSKFLKVHADMIAAYVQCNGHFEGAQTIYTKEADEPFADYTDKSKLADPNSYMPSAREALKGIVDNNVPVWIWHGINDETAPVTRGVSTYEILRKLYKEKGKTDKQIEELVQLTLIKDDEYHTLGIVERHNAVRIAVQHPEFMKWVLDQSRQKNSKN